MIAPNDLPTLNAALNLSSALLLGIGYVAIRRRHFRFHGACMVATLVVSTAFLASYLYYHFVVRNGKPTEFVGPTTVRRFYLSLLLSHTVLAALALPPLAILTVLRACRRQWTRHVWIARLTLPVWAYVSVTGVVVYWMLYHLYPPPT